tara:strand:+ start:339 stop:599 length:261 start_codon:yes stop_codon:yes gene_type:complete
MDIKNVIALSNSLAILVRDYEYILSTKNSINGKIKGELIVNGRKLKVEGRKFDELLSSEVSLNDTELTKLKTNIKTTAEEIISKLK